MPTLLVAPAPTGDLPNTRADYHEGYYADGAYTAAPALLPNGKAIEIEDDEDVDPQEAYYASLCARFADLSASLQKPPTNALIPPPASSNAQALNSGSNSRWRSILNTQPSMLLIGLLSHETVLRGLKILETRLTVENLLKRQSLGVWAWGLLARCRDVGQMGSEEIGILRDLGKKAIWLLRGLQAGFERTDDDDEGLDEGDFENDGREENPDLREGSDPSSGMNHFEPSSTLATSDLVEDTIEGSSRLPPDTEATNSLDAAKVRMLAALPSELGPSTPSAADKTIPLATSSPSPARSPLSKLRSSPKGPVVQEADDQMSQIQAALDMIITVVGEFYGQRDLLDGRIVWGELEVSGD